MIFPIATHTLVAKEMTIWRDGHIAMLKERVELANAPTRRILHQIRQELDKRSRRDSLLDKGQNLFHNSSMNDFAIEVDMTIDNLNLSFRPVLHSSCRVDKVEEFSFGRIVLDSVDDSVPVLMRVLNRVGSAVQDRSKRVVGQYVWDAHNSLIIYFFAYPDKIFLQKKYE
jgi:hypothetical protein